MKIQGKRLLLRPMTRAEYHRVRSAYVSDPLVEAVPYVYAQDEADAAYGAIMARGDAFRMVGIFLNDAPIGELAFKRIDREKGRCELGIALCSDAYKQHGYGTEAFSLALRYAFETLGMRAVYADTMASNVRMQRILERLGFRCFLRLNACYAMGDRWEDRLDYVAYRPERHTPLNSSFPVPGGL